eukprot:Tamp_07993.p2 GENE.Tamp_07993~~Tamp_07993.p2  ORF type:complete len:236 (-),score=45.02 Tamp_07993:1287-1994(-)
MANAKKQAPAKKATAVKKTSGMAKSPAKKQASAEKATAVKKSSGMAKSPAKKQAPAKKADMAALGPKLVAAARKGHLEEVQRLLEMGSPVNTVDKKGWSALINAAWMGHTAVLEALLAAGCKKTHMDLQVGMGSALHRAAYKGHTAVVKSLLAAGCNKNLQNRAGATALHLAAIRGHVSVVKTLLAAGCNPHLRTNKNCAGVRAEEPGEWMCGCTCACLPVLSVHSTHAQIAHRP